MCGDFIEDQFHRFSCAYSEEARARAATFQLWLVLSNDKITTRTIGLTSTEISELRIAYVYETRAPTRYLQVPVYFKLFTENDLTAIELSTFYELTLAKEKPECREIGIREFSHNVGRIWLCEDGVFQRRTVGVKARARQQVK
jgi:hypothetical protein